MINLNPEAFGGDSEPKREKMEIPQISKEMIMATIARCEAHIQDLEAELLKLEFETDPVAKATVSASLSASMEAEKTMLEFFKTALKGL
jgi:hypothetical protein